MGAVAADDFHMFGHLLQAVALALTLGAEARKFVAELLRIFPPIFVVVAVEFADALAPP